MCLPCASLCASSLVHIVSHHIHNHHISVLSSFYRRGNEDAERSSNIFNVNIFSVFLGLYELFLEVAYFTKLPFIIYFTVSLGGSWEHLIATHRWFFLCVKIRSLVTSCRSCLSTYVISLYFLCSSEIYLRDGIFTVFFPLPFSPLTPPSPQPSPHCCPCHESFHFFAQF